MCRTLGAQTFLTPFRASFCMLTINDTCPWLRVKDNREENLSNMDILSDSEAARENAPSAQRVQNKYTSHRTASSQSQHRINSQDRHANPQRRRHHLRNRSYPNLNHHAHPLQTTVSGFPLMTRWPTSSCESAPHGAASDMHQQPPWTRRNEEQHQRRRVYLLQQFPVVSSLVVLPLLTAVSVACLDTRHRNCTCTASQLWPENFSRVRTLPQSSRNHPLCKRSNPFAYPTTITSDVEARGSRKQ